MFLNTMMILLMIASLISGLIVVIGKNKWKRLLGYSLVSAKINMLIIIYALVTNKTFYLDIALVHIVLSYIGVIILASYMVEFFDKLPAAKTKR